MKFFDKNVTFSKDWAIAMEIKKLGNQRFLHVFPHSKNVLKDTIF